MFPTRQYTSARLRQILYIVPHKHRTIDDININTFYYTSIEFLKIISLIRHRRSKGYCNKNPAFFFFYIPTRATCPRMSLTICIIYGAEVVNDLCIINAI